MAKEATNTRAKNWYFWYYYKILYCIEETE
jgi:hypothetical protein